jgi:hypothetical protein
MALLMRESPAIGFAIFAKKHRVELPREPPPGEGLSPHHIK